MEENKHGDGKSKEMLEKHRDLQLELVITRWLPISVIIFFLSCLIWLIILYILLLYIEAFLQVFVGFYTKYVLQILWVTLLMYALACVIIIAFGTCCLLISRRHEKMDEKNIESYFLPFYITLSLVIFLIVSPLLLWVLQMIPQMILQIFHIQESATPQMELRVILRVIFILIFLIFFVLTLLKLCLKHPALDSLFLIWSAITTSIILFYIFILQPLIALTVLFGILTLLMILLKIGRKRINLNAIIKAIKKLVKECVEILRLIYSLIKKIITEIDPFDRSEFRMVNKIYLLLILTFALFTVGVIFIADFTHVEEYSSISRNIELCAYNIPPYTQNITPYILSGLSPSCTPHPNNISFVCSLYHRNIFKDNLTFIKSGRDSHSFYPIDTFCTQYDQHRKDFITYFSTLIVATITFFVMMYEKFIRRKEDTEKIGE